MNREALDYVIGKTHELMEATSCSKEAKEAAKNWLESIGTEKEAEETKKYFAELEADIVLIDDLISFAGSEAGAQTFGADLAKEIAAHGKEIKAAGATHCDCPACAAAAAILEKKESLLA